VGLLVATVKASAHSL